jgi:hypothetical protein
MNLSVRSSFGNFRVFPLCDKQAVEDTTALLRLAVRDLHSPECDTSFTLVAPRPLLVYNWIRLSATLHYVCNNFLQ